MNILKLLATDKNSVEQNLKQKLPNTSGDTGGIDQAFLQNILNWSYVVAGVVAAGFIIFGAYKYISAQGEPEKIKDATKTIIYASIGLVIVLLAAAITNFIILNTGQGVNQL